jgi:hypothetical protein
VRFLGVTVSAPLKTVSDQVLQDILLQSFAGPWKPVALQSCSSKSSSNVSVKMVSGSSLHNHSEGTKENSPLSDLKHVLTWSLTFWAFDSSCWHLIRESSFESLFIFRTFALVCPCSDRPTDIAHFQFNSLVAFKMSWRDGETESAISPE